MAATSSAHHVRAGSLLAEPWPRQPSIQLEDKHFKCLTALIDLRSVLVRQSHSCKPLLLHKASVCSKLLACADCKSQQHLQGRVQCIMKYHWFILAVKMSCTIKCYMKGLAEMTIARKEFTRHKIHSPHFLKTEYEMALHVRLHHVAPFLI